MLGPVRGKPRQYKGFRGATTSGHHILGEESSLQGQHLTGEVKSSEMSKDDQYMLLSLQAHSTVGIVKDTVAGTCCVKEFGDYCQLHEVR